jgi:hypothetical protein
LRVAEDDLEKKLRLAEGAVLTHELTDVEASAGILSGDDDLALWAVLATGGEPVPDGGIAGSLPLVKDGVISGLLRVSTFYDLPPGYCDDAPIGQGMIAQFLLGPDGWLDATSPTTSWRCDCTRELSKYPGTPDSFQPGRQPRPSARPRRWPPRTRSSGTGAVSHGSTSCR